MVTKAFSSLFFAAFSILAFGASAQAAPCSQELYLKMIADHLDRQASATQECVQALEELKRTLTVTDARIIIRGETPWLCEPTPALECVQGAIDEVIQTSVPEIYDRLAELKAPFEVALGEAQSRCLTLDEIQDLKLFVANRLPRFRYNPFNTGGNRWISQESDENTLAVNRHLDRAEAECLTDEERARLAWTYQSPSLDRDALIQAIEAAKPRFQAVLGLLDDASIEAPYYGMIWEHLDRLEELAR